MGKAIGKEHCLGDEGQFNIIFIAREQRSYAVTNRVFTSRYISGRV